RPSEARDLQRLVRGGLAAAEAEERHQAHGGRGGEGEPAPPTPENHCAAKQTLLGSDKNPSGGRVVTYNRWPLYTYIADSKPGQATGQALDLNGGLWYVLSPYGKVITKKTYPRTA